MKAEFSVHDYIAQLYCNSQYMFTNPFDLLSLPAYYIGGVIIFQ